MIAGQGVPLPYPLSPYPPSISGVSSMVWSNKFTLMRATVWTIPPGWWMITTGSHSEVQCLDPVTQTWIPVVASTDWTIVNSDGVNYRLANLSGTPVARATVTAAGATYTAATTTVVSSAGGSTWRALIDGAMSGTVTIGNDKLGNAGGTNFTVPPILVVQAPPAGGIQALAHATISAGAISAVTVDDAGAGYTSAPGIMVIPDPGDPNAGTITIPTLTAALAAATGAITGVLIMWHGTSQGSAPNLTISGGNSAATATVTLVAAAGDDTVTVQWLGGGG